MDSLYQRIQRVRFYDHGIHAVSESIIHLCLSGVARQGEYPAPVKLAGSLFVSDDTDSR
jgi:hypothetical protein